jgi:hypothetical protein
MSSRVLRFSLFCSILAACGGSTVFVEGTPDGGTLPAADGAPNETGTKTQDAPADRRPTPEAASDAAMACVDADLPNLSAPDAALGDAGSIGKCTACIKANCATELQECQDDCDCREAAVGFLDCLAAKKTVTTCGGGLVTAGATAQSLGLCTLNAGCSVACGN